MGWFRQAFAISKPGSVPLTPQQEEIIDRLAAKVVEWEMSVPAVLFLESMKPLNYVGSQLLVFFAPIVNSLFTIKDYDDFVKHGSMQALKEKGLLRLEGKEYAVKDGDIMTIRHSG